MNSQQVHLYQFDLWFYDTHGRQFYEHNENDCKIRDAWMSGYNTAEYQRIIRISPENSYHEP
jgi:hypothetical protein